jgi:hypothetical protein
MHSGRRGRVATWRAKRPGPARALPFVARRPKPTRTTKGNSMAAAIPNENVSDRLPQTDDEIELLKPAIAWLLGTIPESWAEYEYDALTDAQGRALFLLVAAGMVERRIRYRLSMVGHPVSIEATLTATGEYGFLSAVRPIVAKTWSLWADHWRQWNAGESRNLPPFHCSPSKPDEWRLTDQGVLARNDIHSNSQTVFDFVLKRGWYDGQACRLPDGRLSQRLPVCGRGALESLTERPADSASTGVNIANWNAGARAFADAFAAQFADAFAAQFAAMQDKTDADKGQPAEPAGDSTPTKAKRSTERGEGRAKLVAALTKHHQYADGGCLNLEPIGNNELARLAGVSESTASGFFNKQFDGHTKYRVICADATRLVAALKLLNQEFAPHHLFGAKPPGEDEREDEE